MSTRGAWGFIKNDEVKVTYCHGDAYVEHLGEIVSEFVKKYYDELDKICDHIKLVTDANPAPNGQIKDLLPEWSDFTVGSKNKDDWYCLLRNVQDNPEAYAHGCKYMIDSHTFVGSTFCDYSYIINLNAGCLEVRGYTKLPILIPLKKLPGSLTDYIEEVLR